MKKEEKNKEIDINEVAITLEVDSQAEEICKYLNGTETGPLYPNESDM